MIHVALALASLFGFTHGGAEDAAVTLPTGQTVQVASIPFVLMHLNDDRLILFEDGSGALLDCDAGIITGPNGNTHAVTC